MPRPDNVGVGVAVAIMNEDGQLLMIQRAGAHATGCWSLPGGWIEFGESPVQTATREVLEEVDLSLSPDYMRPFAINSETWPAADDRPEWQSVTLYYIANYVEDFDGVPENKEPEKCSGMVWASADDIPSPLFPGLSKVLGGLFAP